jgi:hypothetical protein
VAILALAPRLPDETVTGFRAHLFRPQLSPPTFKEAPRQIASLLDYPVHFPSQAYVLSRDGNVPRGLGFWTHCSVANQE